MCDFLDSNSSNPRKTGESLREDENVIRLGLEQSNYDRIGANHFSLSSKEKKQDWKRISVWETSLTSVNEARAILTNPKRKLVIILNVGDVRSIKLEGVDQLDIKWDRLPNCINKVGQKQPGYIDGCEGHCALDGIHPQVKKLRKKTQKISKTGYGIRMVRNRCLKAA